MLEGQQRALEIDADAWKLLRDTLRAVENEEGAHLGRALAGPVGTRFAELTGGRYRELRLDAALKAEGVGVAGATTKAQTVLGALSVGMRSQLAALIRFTIADQLQSAIVLDDHLVHTDVSRLAWFQDFLRKVAVNAQVVDITCRPQWTGRPPKGSSIAFLLEHGGASVLLAADAYSTVLVPALQALALHRKHPGGLKLDAINLSHHGSRANVTTSLLKSVQADHYIVSTNGAMFNHPDDEAIARVVVYVGRQPRLWFNYDNDRSRRWADPALRSLYGYEVVLPEPGRPGTTSSLGVNVVVVR